MIPEYSQMNMKSVDSVDNETSWPSAVALIFKSCAQEKIKIGTRPVEDDARP